MMYCDHKLESLRSITKLDKSFTRIFAITSDVRHWLSCRSSASLSSHASPVLWLVRV